MKIKKYFLEIWNVLRLPEMLILPGNLAFYLILSLIPIISLMGILAASFNLSITSLMGYFNNILPTEVINIILENLNNSGLATASIVFFLIGFYTASNGSYSLIIASNIVYKNDNKNYIKRKIKALVMTIFILVLFIIILIVLAFGSFILTKLLNFGFIGKFIHNNYLIITILKFVISFLIIFLTIKIIYTISCGTKSKYVNRGSLFATIAIILITTLYSYYVTNLAHYDIIYGSLSSIAILMFLIYIISYVLVLGIAINNQYYNSWNNK